MASTPTGSYKPVLVLPDDAPVDIQAGQDASQPTKVAIGGTVVCAYRTLPRSLALVVSAIGTPFEHAADHIPKFPLLEILPPSAVQPDADADAPMLIGGRMLTSGSDSSTRVLSFSIASQMPANGTGAEPEEA